MHRHRVMNGTTDLMFSKICHQSVPLRASDHVKVIRVLSVGAFPRRRERPSVKAALIAPRNRPASGIVLVQMRKLCAQYRRLQRIEPRIESRFSRLPAIVPTVLAQPAHSFGDFRLARQNYSAVADRAEIFGRIEAEAADIADAAEPPPAIEPAASLRTVLS